MRPTVTASVWNYCQNSCSYCVAGCFDPKWRPKQTFEIWKPAGYEHATDYELRVRFGVDYYHKLCPDKGRYLNAADVLPFDTLQEWLIVHRPDATIHISGGEPLLRPDIVVGIARLITQGFDVIIFTNGLALKERPRLLDLPIKWDVTYHQNCGVSPEEYAKLIEPIRSKPHYLHTVIKTFLHAKAIDYLKKVFSKFNFFPKWANDPNHTAPSFKYNPSDLDDIASYRLTLVTPDGAVYPCNTCKIGPIGTIYQLMHLDDEKARALDPSCRACVQRNLCSAYQTASMLEGI